jgi:hypothetical protein
MYTIFFLKQDKNHVSKPRKSLYKFWPICYIQLTIHQSWVCYTSSENACPHFLPGVKYELKIHSLTSKLHSYESV